MEKDDNLLEGDDSTPEEQELELESEEDSDKGDPLDEIQDTEVLRAEAKKFRSIAQRQVKKPEPKKVEDALPSEFLKKSDYELDNQKKAIFLVTGKAELNPKVMGVDSQEDLVKIQEDIAENWEQIRQFYSSRRGKGTPESIVEDIKDAYVVFNSRRPAKKEEGKNTTGLIETKTIPTGQTPSGGRTQTSTKEPPGFSMPTQPKDWYPKKE